MSRSSATFFLALVIALLVHVVPGEAQSYVIGVDSTNRVAHRFSTVDGSLLQADFLDWDLLGTGGSTAKQALQVGNQIWVSDQLRDLIYRFDLAGSHLGNIGNAGLDNIKGMQVVGNEVWVTNAGTGNGAPGNSVVRVDIGTNSIIGSFSTVGSLFDLINYQGQILGSNITNHNLEFYNNAGVFTGNFYVPATPGMRFPQQMFIKNNGDLLVAGFSPTSGVYEITAGGVSNGIVAASGLGPRGVFQLDNGQIMWTNGSGFFVGATNVLGGSGQYLNLINPSPIPEPSLAGLGTLLLAWAGFRRQPRRT